MLDVLYQPLLWGLVAVGIPIIIHLINMLRHRRVEWAAMEFLLISQKKHRTWIIFKQLLLLLLRMLAIAAIVILVAGPVMRNWVGRLIGSSTTHHIVLLDDSFSMSDRWADKTAFGEAKEVVKKIGEAAFRRGQDQEFTLLRFSGAVRHERPALLQEKIKTGFDARLKQELDAMTVSETAPGPGQALEALGEILDESEDQRCIVYIISDFRSREWEDPGELKDQLAELDRAETELHLVHCVEEARPNLAITSLAPAGGIRAVDVAWQMEVAVKNFGTEEARNVHVYLEQEKGRRQVATIRRILPGQEVKKVCENLVGQAGPYQMALSLGENENDSLALDSFRHHVLDVPQTVPVLVVDGSTDFRDAVRISTALSPGGNLRTGLEPQTRAPGVLSKGEPLEKYHSIILTNVSRLDPTAIAALEQYVDAGGGLAIFLGERSTSTFINENLHRDGDGLFPVPLANKEPVELRRELLDPAPDLQVENHPIFEDEAGKPYMFFIRMVNVYRYFAVRDGWQPAPDSDTRVIAKLRNGAPLAIERGFGQGRVIVFLTSVAAKRPSIDGSGPPEVWNDWANNPAFVLAMQQMQHYLCPRASIDASQQVGSKLVVQLDGEEQAGRVGFFVPGDDAAPIMPDDVGPSGGGAQSVSFSDTNTSGIYRVEIAGSDGGPAENRYFAFNVDAAEGSLATLTRDELAAQLKGVEYKYAQAEAFKYEVDETPGENIFKYLLCLLIVLFICEMLLAYSASYHPTARPVLAAAKGGAL